MDIAKRNAAQMYKETSVKTADGGKLIVLLYEEIDKHLTEAIALLKKEKKHRYYDQVNYHITRSQKILVELIASLDSSQSQEIYDNLLNLYLFFNDELTNANTEKSYEPIIPIKEMIVDLLETWRVASKKNVHTDTPKRRTGLNISG